MKKIIALISLVGLLVLPVNGYAYDNDQNAFKRILISESRGLLNLATAPLELIYTPIRELKKHPKAWFVTFIPRAAGNLIYRAVSGVNDAFFYPFYGAFAKDNRPWTEPMGLSDYVFQKPADKF